MDVCAPGNTAAAGDRMVQRWCRGSLEVLRWWGALDKPVEQRAKDRLADTETSSLREFFMETALSDKYNRQSRESPFRVQFAPTVADGARPTNSTKTTVAPAVNTTYAHQHVPTVPDILKTLGMDENCKFAITDPDADARIIRDYLADNNTFVKRSDLAAVLKTDEVYWNSVIAR
jgi:hypothetical protein